MEPIAAEVAKYQRRISEWLNANRVPKKCKFCEYKHDGYHDYTTHLQQDHPTEYEEFKLWAGIGG